MQNVNALLTDEQYEHLRNAAHETRRSMSEILREALDAWFASTKEGAA
jgi:predicted DNA-binding protein